MLPLTRFLSCTDPIDRFDSISHHQKCHAKMYITGLIAATNKTIDGIAWHVMPATNERALNKFLGEYDRDDHELVSTGWRSCSTTTKPAGSVDEFGDNVVVLLDQASYFYATDLWEFVGGARTTEFVDDTSVERVVGDSLQVWYFTSHALELHPVEG
jgi:hypothetical protein